MLFNPLWIVGTEDVDRLETLISWLETRAPDTTYDYSGCRGCLLAQYYGDHGYAGVNMKKEYFTYRGFGVFNNAQMLPEHFNWIAQEQPHDYGHALERARLAQSHALERARLAQSHPLAARRAVVGMEW